MLKQQRLNNLLKNLSGHLSEFSASIWQNLVAAYQQPHRHYHTEQHIAECLQIFDCYQHLANQPLAVECALWFHDVVYQPQRSDNERQSAEWAKSLLQQAQVSAALIEQIYALIIVTTHQQHPQNQDEKLIVDIDLSILAAAPDRFAEYERQIRAEYNWVSAQDYQHKRGQVLARLYNHGNIYHLPEFKTFLEPQAKANLEKILLQRL